VIPLRDNNPRFTTPYVTWGLIGINVVVFLFESSLGPYAMQGFVFTLGLIPYQVTAHLSGGALPIAPAVAAPFLTSMFLHGGWFHLLGNMLYLYIFGDNVEDTLGHVPFLIFYLVCGLGAGLAHYAVQPLSQAPVVGASGAIAGVLGAYVVIFPRARVLTLVPIFIFIQFMELPAQLLLGIWFLMQFFNGFLALGPAGSSGGGVAWWAHIGGFLLGMLGGRILPRRRGSRVIYL
jgi:membrane associated rhomboid family serine protease